MNQKQFSSVLNQGKRHESCQTWQRKVCDHFCETFIFLKYGSNSLKEFMMTPTNDINVFPPTF